MSYEIEGNVFRIEPTKVISDKFSVREIILETDDKYPQLIRIQFANAKIDELDGYSVGDTVTVRFRLRGKESAKGIVFTNLDGFAISGEKRHPNSGGDEFPAASDDDGMPF